MLRTVEAHCYLMPYRKDLEASLLIEKNCPRAIKTRKIIPGFDHYPYRIRTYLGCGIINRVCLSPLPDSTEDNGVWINTITTRELTSTYECGKLRCGSRSP